MTSPADPNILDSSMEQETTKRPDWLKVRMPQGPNYGEIKGLLRGLTLHSVCEEAHCPNIGECFESRTATFLILGRVCTRNCRFCAVESGRPTELDLAEPERVAQATSTLQLRHVVVTSVTRDDLEDGGSDIFAETVRRVRELVPGCSIEVLIPDFQGSEASLETVVRARPDILNHNVETVARLSPLVRPKANYERSIEVLYHARQMDATIVTKSGVMVGLGETMDEVLEAMRDLREADCNILTIGQYLSPSKQHLPVQRYCSPEEFAHLRAEGERMGFGHVEAGPLVRSSYHAKMQLEGMGKTGG